MMICYVRNIAVFTVIMIIKFSVYVLEVDFAFSFFCEKNFRFPC